MVQNKTTDHKCVACQAPKPGTQPTLSSPPKAPVTTPLAGLATKIAKASETKSDAPSDSSKLLGFKQSDIAKPSITLGTVTGKDSVAKPGSDTFKSSFTSQKTEPIPAVTTFAFGVQKTNESTGFSFAHNVSGSKSQDKKLDVGGAVDVKVGKVETRGFKFDAGAATSKQSVAPAVNFGVVPPQSGSVSVAPAVNFGVVPPQSGSVSVAGQNIKKEETPASHEVKPAFGFGKPLPSGVNSKVNDAPPNVTITPSAGFVFNAGSTQSNQTAVQPIATGAGGFNFTAVKTEHKNKSDAVPKVANMFGAPSGESTAAGFQATTTSSSIVPSSQKSTSSPFVFGGNNTSTTNSTTTNASTPNASGAGFSFNSAPTGGFNATQLSMFTGASANTNKPAVSFAATGALKTGSPALGNSTSGFGSTSGNFSFGAGATQQSTDVSATSVFPSATPFGQQSANSGALPAFGAGSAPAFGAGTTTGFGSSAGASTFANTNNTSVSTPTQQSATPAPFGGISSGTPPVNMFGAGAFNAAGSQQNTSAASAGGFAFQPNPSGGFGTLGGAAAAGTGVFQFGGTNDSAAPQQAPSTFSTPGGSTGNQAFNFTAAGSSPAPFNFGANPAAPSNMFSASGTPGARKIKRPVRRRK
uniref:Nuclear pore complex protein Nup153-like n=1 Tax=Saccoglossus kowalevskii TaxID=10224 RepID=A0ABM0MG21_SACKO|nr:PREDICTED: nuclear pore complex protein Nup153-like [Saccoglossus kowalevskii]